MIKGFEWTSRVNAIAPYDFTITHLDSSVLLVDAKSTTGNFAMPLHISMAEIETMATSAHEYAICRIYNITENSGELRIANNMRFYAKELKQAFENLPFGARVDSISCDPTKLDFGETETLFFYDEDE